MHSPTRSGYNLSEVSSAFQKSIRRSRLFDALEWGTEAYLSNMAQRTNIWNRALVVSVEDIGLGSPEVFHSVATLYLAAQELEPDDPLAYRYFGMAITLLASAPSSRATDWSAKLFAEVNAMLGGKTPQTRVSDELAAQYIATHGNLLHLRAQLNEALEAHHLADCLYFARAIFYSPERIVAGMPKSILAPRGTMPYLYIFDLLCEHTAAAPNSIREYYIMLATIARLDTWGNSVSKTRLLYIMGIHLWCLDPVARLLSIKAKSRLLKGVHGLTRGNFIREASIHVADRAQIELDTAIPLIPHTLTSPLENLESYLDTYESQRYLYPDFDALLTRHQEEGCTLEIPEYAIDKHTSRGKASGADSSVFIEEGTLLARENPAFTPLSLFYLFWGFPDETTRIYGSHLEMFAQLGLESPYAETTNFDSLPIEFASYETYIRVPEDLSTVTANDRLSAPLRREFTMGRIGVQRPSAVGSYY